MPYALRVANNRRDARYPARIVARIIRRSESLELLTNDVSFRGVFLRTDAPPALRQLVKLELVLPEGTLVSGHAMVVHASPRPEDEATEGRVPGIGLQFWGAIENRREWERFIHELRSQQRMGATAAKVTDKVRRASERIKLALEVRLDGTTLMTRDISENGLALRTELPLTVGLRAEVTLRAREEVLKFDAIVRRIIDEPDFRGVGVELVDMSADHRDKLARFLRASAPSEPRVFVSADDPELH